MKPQNFVALLTAAVLSLAVAVTAYVSSRPWTAATGKGEAMLPALRPAEDKIAAIEIVQGSNTVKLALKDGKWVVASQEDYPASVDAVRKLLLNASEASLVERKTAKKDMLGLLGLSDPKVSGASSRLIRFLDANGNPIAEVVAGNSKSEAFGVSKNGTYVRIPGSDQSWLADRPVDGSANLSDWVKTRVIDIPTNSIKTASIEVAGQPAYAVDRDTDGSTHKLAQMPPGKKLKYVNSVDEIIESASYVDFKGVRKAGKADSLPSAGKATFETDKGLKIGLDIKSDGKQAWIIVTPAGSGDAKKDADDIAALVTGWEFEIPVAKVSGLLKKEDDLLENAGS
jgi:hypothetical protein